MKHLNAHLTSLLIVCIGIGSAIRCPALADGPEDNIPDKVRPIPPVGLELEEAQIQPLRQRAAKILERLQALPDVEQNEFSQVAVFPRAVQITLDTGMIYQERELRQADDLLAEAERRLEVLGRGGSQTELMGLKRSQLDGRFLAVGGFRSELDGSIQPFGLDLPQDFDERQPLRLDIWLHGRGERVSEVAFLQQRLTKGSQYAPANTIVLHPYGRYSNAFKFAGEIDVLEALAHVRELFPVDEQRITIRGFSMGGAGCWQLAVHYPDLFAAATPGAGFSETTQFLRSFQQEAFQAEGYLSKLLHWYDCPDWTNNLRNVPTIAYSGELDRQKQAADVMAEAFASRGMELPHIIGAGMGHQIDDKSKQIVQDLLEQRLAVGKPAVPTTIDFTTYMLRYNRLAWLQVTQLEEHWREARVQGALKPGTIELTTQNIRSLKLDVPACDALGTPAQIVVRIDGQELTLPHPDGGACQARLTKSAQAGWQVQTDAGDTLRKQPGLQGPIDDAFMGPFLLVGPETPDDATPAERWAQSEFEHAKAEWRRHFRGDVRAKSATEVTAEDHAHFHLILFGTPRTNALIAEMVNDLPVTWTASRVALGTTSRDAETHVPLLIYPNPRQPERYVVLNSGFTFREYAYLNNARQIPMLPDWALVDIRRGATSQYPGEIVAADFFDESWQIKPESTQP